MAEAEVIRIDHGRRADTTLCLGRTADGRPCKNRAGASGFCRRHEPASEHPAAQGPSRFEADLERALAFLRRRVTGAYTVDDFGFYTEVVEHQPEFFGMLAKIAQTCAEWDGSDPVRLLQHPVALLLVACALAVAVLFSLAPREPA